MRPLFRFLLLAAVFPAAAAALPAQNPQNPQNAQPAQTVQQQASQQPQMTISVQDSDSSVPLSTVVPVQKRPVDLTEYTTVYDEPTREMTRAERRAWKAERFAARIDSLVQSRSYLFYPNSMQQMPKGLIRMIYADYFYFGLFTDHVEVHLPAERGVTQYVEMLNFDSMNLRNYRASRTQWGWNITFDVTDAEVVYPVDIAVSTTTGETVLTLLTPQVAMRYVGWITGKIPKR